MLPLDDPRWRDLDHRGWSAGKRSDLDADAPYVPDELRHLVADPADRDRFEALWPYLCSEGTAWPAAYAAVPYLVALARQLPAADRAEHVTVVGLVAACATPPGLPGDVAAAYRQALPEALALLAETLVSPHDEETTQFLLVATAALKGHTPLAEALLDLDLSELPTP